MRKVRGKPAKQSAEVMEILIWATSLIGMGIGLVAYANSNFMTAREAQTIDRRLDRIEAKLDTIMSAQGIVTTTVNESE